MLITGVIRFSPLSYMDLPKGFTPHQLFKEVFVCQTKITFIPRNLHASAIALV